jgi:hypothetical protein
MAECSASFRVQLLALAISLVARAIVAKVE